MLDQITGMRVFSRVAALGTLSAAARDLGMSQTMATKHVAALEDRLGVKLLHRTTRKITLTEPGRRFLDSAERILEELAEAEAAATAERLEATGTLRLNSPVSFGTRELAPLMAEFGALYPSVTVDMGLSDRVIDLVEEGWDVAVRIGTLNDESLIARKLAPCRTVVAGSPLYLENRGTPTTVAELPKHNCLGYTLSDAFGPDHWSFGTDGSATVPVRGNFRANNGDALVAAAVAGQGLIYEPTFLMAEELRKGSLIALPLDKPPLELEGIFAIYASTRRPPAKVRVFIDFLVERFSPVAPWERD